MVRIAKTNDAGRQKIIQHGKSENKSVKLRASVIDWFEENGWISTDTISPTSKGSTCTPENWEWAKESVLLSFSIADQKLVNMPAKLLTKQQMSDRRYVMQQVNSRLGGYGKGLLARELGGTGKGGTARPADIRVKLKVNECLTIIDKVADETQLVNGEQIKSLFKQVIALLPK